MMQDVILVQQELKLILSQSISEEKQTMAIKFINITFIYRQSYISY